MVYQFKNVFNCSDPEKISTIIFCVTYCNNFVGYLNGEEVIRKEHGLDKINYDEVNLSGYRNKLQYGSNEFLIEISHIPIGLTGTNPFTENKENEDEGYLLFDADIFLI